MPSAPPPFDYGIPDQKISLTALHTTSPGSHSGGTLPRNLTYGYHHFHHPSQAYSTVNRTMYAPYPLAPQSEYIPGQMSTEFPDGNVTIGFHQPPPPPPHPGNLGFMPPPYPPMAQSNAPPVSSQFSGPVSVGYSRIQAPHESHSSHQPHHQYQPSFSRSHNQQFTPAHHNTSPPSIIDGGPNSTEVYNATTVTSSSQSVSNAYKRRRGLIAVSCFTGLILLIILIVFSL